MASVNMRKLPRELARVRVSCSRPGCGLFRGMRARNADGQLDTDTTGKKFDWRGSWKEILRGSLGTGTTRWLVWGRRAVGVDALNLRLDEGSGCTTSIGT